MMRTKADPAVVDRYISGFSPEIANRLEAVRECVHKEAPEAIEKMSYGGPAFYLNGNLVVYAAFKNHLGFYPTPPAIKAFARALADYETSRGTIKFPHEQPQPLDLIASITRFRLNEQQSQQK